ncbi:MAG TPA: hypothetical protein DEP87_03460 [Candidatus Pacebacteria bacterium]|nr:hypothetical protein [Candidatus Paceibacterota bacterium]
MSDWRSEFQTAFPNLDCKRDFPLQQLTYFKIGGPAELLVLIKTLTELQKVVAYLKQHKLKFVILGGASNVVVADEGIQGVVLQLQNQTFEVKANTVLVGAGLKTSLLVKQTVAAGLTGLEVFLGVPGTVGGAVLNNAHYLSKLIAEYIVRVQVVTLSGETFWLSKAEADFGYDYSRFQTSGEIIWQVEFQLPLGEIDKSKEQIRMATEYRAKTQPLGLASSGCIFQNVPNTAQLRELLPQFAEKDLVPGGFLIDQAGLKGLRVGDLEVSQKHAAFIVNHGQGTAEQLRQLIDQVKAAVKTKFGVELHEEVFYLR